MSEELEIKKKEDAPYIKIWYNSQLKDILQGLETINQQDNTFESNVFISWITTNAAYAEAIRDIHEKELSEERTGVAQKVRIFEDVGFEEDLNNGYTKIPTWTVVVIQAGGEGEYLSEFLKNVSEVYGNFKGFKGTTGAYVNLKMDMDDMVRMLKSSDILLQKEKREEEIRQKKEKAVKKRINAMKTLGIYGDDVKDAEKQLRELKKVDRRKLRL